MRRFFAYSRGYRTGTDLRLGKRKRPIAMAATMMTPIMIIGTVYALLSMLVLAGLRVTGVAYLHRLFDVFVSPATAKTFPPIM